MRRIGSSPGRRGARKAARAVAVVLILAGSLIGLAARVPYDEGDLDFALLAALDVRARDGTPLRMVPGGEFTRAEWVPLARISPRLIEAMLAAEDVRFRRHPGIDLAAVARAALDNLRAGRIVSGGSTITQQLAGLVWPEAPTPVGKWREAVRAIRLEIDFSKDEILEHYLNRVPMGPGLIGVGAASRRYFDRSPERLGAEQAATLAALPQSPSRLSQAEHRDALRERRNRILERMARAGFLSAGERAEIASREVSLGREDPPFAVAHFVDWLLARRDPSMLGATMLRTTIDPVIQADVEGIVRAHRPDHRGLGADHVAVVVLDIATGDILAMVGSPDWTDPAAGQVNGAVRLRQPGSALKPFLYALAFDRGHSPADRLADVPLRIVEPDGGEVAPRNYDERFRGPVRMREALAGSINVPAIRLQQELGTAETLELLRRAGLESLRRPASYYGIGLVLGVGEVTLLDLVNAYAGLARGGVWRPARAVLEARGVSGGVIELTDPAPRRWVDPGSAFLVQDILADDGARLRGFGPFSPLDLPFPVVVKTGTSSGFRDAWCLGFDGAHAVGVWSGNFDGSPVHGRPGARLAAPVFRAILIALHERGSPSWRGRPPEGWERREVCGLSGDRPGLACAVRQAEWFGPGAYEHRPHCSMHRRLGDAVAVVWPAEYQAWAAEAGFSPDSGRLPAGDPSVRSGRGDREEESAGEDRPRIVSPVAGSTYIIDEALGDRMRIRFSGSGMRGGCRWVLDGRELTPGADGTVLWRPSPGHHHLALVGEHGREEVRFSVK